MPGHAGFKDKVESPAATSRWSCTPTPSFHPGGGAGGRGRRRRRHDADQRLLAHHRLALISMFTAGYVFKNYAHMTKVLNGEIGQDVFARVSRTGRCRWPRSTWAAADLPLRTRPSKPRGFERHQPAHAQHRGLAVPGPRWRQSDPISFSNCIWRCRPAWWTARIIPSRMESAKF